MRLWFELLGLNIDKRAKEMVGAVRGLRKRLLASGQLGRENGDDVGFKTLSSHHIGIGTTLQS